VTKRATIFDIVSPWSPVKAVPKGRESLRGLEDQEWDQRILALGLVLILAIISAITPGFVLSMGKEDEAPEEPSILAGNTSQVAGAVQTGAVGGGGGGQGSVAPAVDLDVKELREARREDRVICVVFKIKGAKVYLQHISGKTAHNLKSRWILVLIPKCLHLLLSIYQNEHQGNRVGRAASFQES
jgi:hypothetical protein